jgi:hypothetical protein
MPKVMASVPGCYLGTAVAYHVRRVVFSGSVFYRRTLMANAKGRIKGKIDNAASKTKRMTEKAFDKSKEATRSVGQKVKNAGQTIKNQGK